MTFSDRYGLNPSDPKDWSPTVQPGAYSGPSSRDTGGIEFYEGPSPARSGYRRRIGTADDGNPIYRNLTAEERKIPEFSLDSEREARGEMRTRLAEERARKLYEEQRRLDRQQWTEQLGLQRSQLQALISNQTGQIGVANRQIELQGQDSSNRHLQAMAGINATVQSANADRIQRSNEFDATQTTLRDQIAANNLLQNRKMDIEERQYGLTMQYNRDRLAQETRAYDRAGKIQALTSAAALLARAF